MLPKGEYAFVTKKDIAELMSAIDALRVERDEARATYCRLLEAYKRGDGREEAKKRGWDCFKENA